MIKDTYFNLIRMVKALIRLCIYLFIAIKPIKGNDRLVIIIIQRENPSIGGLSKSFCSEVVRAWDFYKRDRGPQVHVCPHGGTILPLPIMLSFFLWTFYLLCYCLVHWLLYKNSLLNIVYYLVETQLCFCIYTDLNKIFPQNLSNNFLSFFGYVHIQIYNKQKKKSRLMGSTFFRVVLHLYCLHAKNFINNAKIITLSFYKQVIREFLSLTHSLANARGWASQDF